MSGDQLDLDAIEARLSNAGANLYTLGTHDVPALVAEVRRLREALDGRGVVLRDAYNDATRTRDAIARRAYAAEEEARGLRAVTDRVRDATADMRARGWRYEADKIDRALSGP